MEVHILASGSDGNCAIVRDGETSVMIDAGLSCKRIVSLMGVHGIDPSEIRGILITHEHTDHVQGAGTSARRFDCPVYCNDRTFGAFKPGKVDHVSIDTMKPFSIGTLSFLPMPTSHDAVDPCCYRFESSKGGVGVIATDTGYFTFPVKQALKDADIAVMESNYDKRMLDEGPYPYYLKKRIDGDHGHMSNILCGATVKEIYEPEKKIFLAHLSRTNNIPDLARETVAEVAGISKYRLDCLDGLEDTRILKCRA